MISVIIIHLILAIILFFTINLLGQYTPSSLGYCQLSIFRETNEAPAFNFVIRVLTPAIYITILSTIFYTLGLDYLTKNIYLIGVYYVLFRGIFNIVINRAKLINWPKYFLYALSIVLLSYFVYTKFIVTKTNILPDFNNMANELWIIIILFLYNLLNKVELSDKRFEKRKNNYLKIQFERVDSKYSSIINKETEHPRLRQLALAIIIYEDFNRPKLFRIIEYVNYFLTRKPHTLGIMQVNTSRYIDDKKSVTLGTRKLVRDYQTLKPDYQTSVSSLNFYQYGDELFQQKLIEKYNPDMSYVYEILQLTNEINSKYGNNGPIYLFHEN